MDELIKKKVLHAGISDGQLDFTDGCKVIFHFRTVKSEDDAVVVDDTRDMGRPMEFIYGKKFKLEAWEHCIKSMKINEVAEFRVDKTLVTSYPLVSKMVRQAFGHGPAAIRNSDDHHQQNTSHCCGMMALSNEGIGHADLDDLLKNPCDLLFTIELLQVIPAGEYEKESWAMDDDEKLKSIPKLRSEGNELYKSNQYVEASAKYAEALGRLEQLLIREKPGDDAWHELDKMKIPLLLNYSQCKLLEGDYYPVIEHTSEVLKKDPDNVKALYRRAQANVRVWNPDEARRDYRRVQTLDPSLSKAVDRELKSLDEEVKRKNDEDKAKLQGKMF